MVITNEATYIEFAFSSENVMRIAKNVANYRHQGEDYIRISTPIGEIEITDASYVTLIDDNVNLSDTSDPADLDAIATALEVDDFLYTT